MKLINVLFFWNNIIYVSGTLRNAMLFPSSVDSIASWTRYSTWFMTFKLSGINEWEGVWKFAAVKAKEMPTSFIAK